MELRPYQRAAIDAAFSYVASYDGHPLLVIPTGGGKSLVMGTLIAEALGNDPSARALVLAHRKELIQQNVKAVATVMPLGRIGIYSAGLKRRDVDVPVLVAGIQSVGKKPYAIGAFDVILIDEAHLVPPADDTLYRKFIEAARIQNPKVRFIGLTATPYRLTTGLLHRGKNALFTDIAYEAGVTDLIEAGYLCRLISKATLTRLSVEGVATRAGEFVPGQLEKAVDQDDTTQAIVQELLATCANRNRWLVFCAGVSHAEHVAEALRTAGVAAAAVHGETPAEDRADALAMFKSGRLRALTSMDVLTTGYDEPSIDAIVMLRPTKSTGLYVQMVGRGFRLHPAKTDTLVLDFAGNVARHGPVDRIEVRDVVDDKGAGVAPTKECPACRTILFAGIRVCPECAFEFPPPERPPILPQASMLPVLSTEEQVPEWHDITEVEYARHEKEGKPDSLRVEYFDEFYLVASEWVCLEHGGFAAEKARSWWKLRSPGRRPPESVDDALERVIELAKPIQIAIVRDGKFKRVVEVRFATEESPGPATLPRACWSCGHWSDSWKNCTKWNAEPPAEVQAVGCEAWTEELAEIPF